MLARIGIIVLVLTDLKQGSNSQSIGTFALVMINFAAIANIRALPSVAPYGLSMLFFYFMAVVCFLIPSALVSAELASAFPGEGGIYHWVAEAMGSKLGFFAVWLQNSNNFICFPATLSFVASTLAYGMFPDLADSKIFTLLVILSIIWGGTMLTLNGVKVTGVISAIGGIAGTFIPIILIVSIGLLWLAKGKHSNVIFSFSALMPDLHSAGSVALFMGVLLGFVGIEMSANHIQDVKNPQKKYPRAIFISALLILFVYVLGSLAIAIVIPKHEIALNAGVMQTLAQFFAEVNMPWLLPMLSLAMTIGSIAWFCTWVSGPARALHATALNGDLPKYLQRLNRHNMPTNIMFVQGITASLLSVLFLFAESISVAFWMLTVVTAQFALLMYVMMFAAGMILRWKYPKVARPYSVPCGNIGMCVISGAGFLICLLFYIIGFFPPDEIHVQSKANYSLIVLIINLTIGVLPYMLLQIFKKPSWKEYNGTANCNSGQ